MEDKKQIKVIVHNNTDLASDRDAQRVILDYYKHINESGHKKFYEFLNKTGQTNNNYETVFYLNQEYHPKHTDKFYSNKIQYRTNVFDAYMDALNGDDESPSFIRVYVKDGIKGLVAITEFDIYNDYDGDKYNERGYLKEEIKKGAVEQLKKELLVEDKYENGGGIEYPKVQYKGDDRAFYYVVGEYDKDNYILVFEEKLDHWKNTKDKAERREYFEEIDAKSEFEPYTKFENGGEIEKSEIEQKIENRIKERQRGKEFQDTGVVGYTRKYSAAYDIITSADLSKIETDNVTAYKLIEKSKIWIPYNVETLKAQGNSSGAAYLKVKAREALSARPIDTKLGREVYVKNIEKLIVTLDGCKTVLEVKNALESFVNLDSFDFIDLSHLKNANYSYSKDIGNLKNHYKNDVLKYFEDIFGKRFYAFCRFTSESARKIFIEANLYSAFTSEERQSVISGRQSDLNKRIKIVESILPLITDDETENKSTVNDLDKSFGYYNYSKIFLERNYTDKLKLYNDSLLNLEPNLNKIYIVRENDWSWSGIKDKKKKEEVADIDKVAKEPVSIMQKYGIDDWKSKAKRLPLAYIKRTGGLDVNEISTKEIQDKFGYRNVIFGNYVNDKESKEHSRHFIGAMLDLHEMMNLNVKQINEIGGLDINFGSTGCGSFSLAMACYFRDKKAINLTKKTGDGSVAHEWSHYLDNILGEGSMRGATGRQMATEDKVSYKDSSKIKYLFAEWNNWLRNGGSEKEVEIEYSAQKKYAFKIFGEDLDSAIEGIKKRYPKYALYSEKNSPDLIKYYGYLAYKFNNGKPINVKFKTKASSYYVVSAQYGGEDYWTSSKELFARAFEWSIEEMLKRKGRVSNYLVDIQNSMGLMALMIPYHLHPYPRVKEEQEWLLDWFDRLFSAIRTEYGVTPFNWDTVERTDEYLEYDKKDNDVVADGVSVSEETGEAEVIGSDIEQRENGYSFKRNVINETTIYTVLVNEKATDYYIGTSKNYGNKSNSSYLKNGWVILTKLPAGDNYLPIMYFKTLKESQDYLVNNSEKLEPIKVQELPKVSKEYVREEVKYTPITMGAKIFIPSNQYSIIKTNPEFEDVRIRINKLALDCPKTYETEDIKDSDKIAYLHYFTGGSDWYIIEKDSEVEQTQAFGYVILNGDLENAEFGYINIEEVKKYAELDLYWTPIKIGIIRGEKEELTKQDYIDALNGAEIALDFTYGKDKEDLSAYIRGLKVLIEFA